MQQSTGTVAGRTMRRNATNSPRCASRKVVAEMHEATRAAAVPG